MIFIFSPYVHAQIFFILSACKLEEVTKPIFKFISQAKLNIHHFPPQALTLVNTNLHLLLGIPKRIVNPLFLKDEI